MKTLVVIPARLESTRFPKKLLHGLPNGKIMLHNAIQQVVKATFGIVSKVVVAVDHPRLLQEAYKAKLHENVPENFLEIMMTSDTHRNGTSRAVEVMLRQPESYDRVLVISADEVFLHRKDVVGMILRSSTPAADVVTVVQTHPYTDPGYKPQSTVKIITDHRGVVIDLVRDPETYKDGIFTPTGDWYEHTGIYLYKPHALKLIHEELDPPGMLERDIELLKAVEYGLGVHTIYTDQKYFNINFPRDLEVIQGGEKIL